MEQLKPVVNTQGTINTGRIKQMRKNGINFGKQRTDKPQQASLTLPEMKFTDNKGYKEYLEALGKLREKETCPLNIARIEEQKMAAHELHEKNNSDKSWFGKLWDSIITGSNKFSDHADAYYNKYGKDSGKTKEVFNKENANAINIAFEEKKDGHKANLIQYGMFSALPTLFGLVGGNMGIGETVARLGTSFGMSMYSDKLTSYIAEKTNQSWINGIFGSIATQFGINWATEKLFSFFRTNEHAQQYPAGLAYQQQMMRA